MNRIKKATRIICALCAILLVVALIPEIVAKAGSTPGIYDIKFNSNGVAVTNLPKDFSVGMGSLFAIPSKKPVRKNYSFEGYATSPAANRIAYRAGQGSIVATKDLTLYPIWTHMSQCRVSFWGNDAGVRNLPQDFVVGAGALCAIPSQVPRRDGYDFLYYSTSPSGNSGTKYYPGQGSVRVPSSMILYPIWHKCDHAVHIHGH